MCPHLIISDYRIVRMRVRYQNMANSKVDSVKNCELHGGSTSICATLPLGGKRIRKK